MATTTTTLPWVLPGDFVFVRGNYKVLTGLLVRGALEDSLYIYI